ncbi:DEAD/DEAH box helicase [Bacillus songklensis]|uniref:DEAD/DEAH box helicase n=1 Tax=Bacillus songklensis TaxID=1069116 RepID=A0ABV8B8N2_9BACI
MRFTVIDKQLLPEPLAAQGSDLQPISSIPQWCNPPMNSSFSYSADLQSFLDGKELLPDDLPFPLTLIHQHYEHGYLSYVKGIKKEKGYFCHRCGNEKQERFASFHCARCQQVCTYCRACIVMGRVSECTPLLRWTGPPLAFSLPADILHWDGTLSPAQKIASGAVVTAIKHKQELLVWAVCGAGKTEVLFPGIEAALAFGKKVCIATPRTDVVLELKPRLQKAFAEVEVIALYGSSEDRGKQAPLTISTTHQLLRYSQAFDVVIIDEVDAFPYSVEPMLQYAVQKAKREDAAVIYLTATPNQTWQKEVKQGKRKAVTIPARYHRHPLPVPRFEWCGNWKKSLKQKRLPSNVHEWITERFKDGKQSFLFIPRIELIPEVVKLLKVMDERIEGVHAEDPDRKEKVLMFRNGQIPLLVTTTILERGVTVPNIDVAVLGAEDDIFTESALVQISGRVGRSAQFPDGDLVFFHYGKTKNMLLAKRQIEQMNREARKKRND